HNRGNTYRGRTLVYLDSMRDLDVNVGPTLLAELAPALRVLFEASRWYCGEVNAFGRRVIERSLPGAERGPFAPVLAQVLKTLRRRRRDLAEIVAELQRRLAIVLRDPDQATAGTRAAHTFADHRPAWRLGVFQSVDVLIAAPDIGAVATGNYLAVVGDVHPG